MKIILQLVFLFFALPVSAQYQLDSVIYIQQDRVTKVVQQVDPSLNRWLKRDVQAERETGALLDGTQELREFDQHQNEIRSIFSQWGSTANVWQDIEKTEREFDGKSRLVFSRESIRTGDQWQVQSFDTVLYTDDSIANTSHSLSAPESRNVAYLAPDGQERRVVNYSWNADAKEWEPWMKTDFDYLRDSILQESRTYKWGGDAWIRSEKTSYVFDKDADRSTGELRYIGTEAGWQPREKTARTDSPERRMTTDTVYRWAPEDGRWHPDVIYVTYLNAQNKETDYLVLKVKTGRDTTEVLHERMNMYNQQGKVTLHQEIYFEDNKPTSGYQQTYRFDKDGNVLHYSIWELDVSTDQWKETAQTDFTFHHDILLSEDGGHVVSDVFQLGAFNYSANRNAVAEAKVFHVEHGNKTLHEHVLFFYSPTNLKQ